MKGISKEGLAVATEKALKFLAGYGISEERVIAFLGKEKNAWASEDIASLRGMASQLKDGQATAEYLFPASEAQEERPKAATPKGETKPKRARAPKAEAPVNTTPSASLLPQAAAQAQDPGWFQGLVATTRVTLAAIESLRSGKPVAL